MSGVSRVDPLLLLLAGVLLSVPATAAPRGGARPPQAEAVRAAGGEMVGQETCVTCHDTEGKSFAEDPHTRIALMHGGDGVTCESCHGPGRAHVDGGGDISKIFNPAKASPAEVDARCLGCHAGRHANFNRSEHARSKVSCVSCHTIHGAGGREQLLKADQPGLCFGCHNDQRSQFDMPFHHRVNEGLVRCSDCHNPHGTWDAKQIRTTADRNEICTRCHMDKRGPFVFEHAVIKGEGCLSCHTPHGSENARLLNMPNINPLCNQCHSPVASGSVHGMGTGSTNAQPCIDCHTQIHGSNMNWAFLR